MINKLPLLLKFISILFFNSLLFSNTDYIYVNTSKLPVAEFAKITAKILNKNILISDKIDGEISFSSNVKIHKNELLNILNSVLVSKELQIVDNDHFLILQKAVQSNNKTDNRDDNIISEIIFLNNIDGKELLHNFDALIKGNKKQSTSKTTYYQDSNSILFVGADKDFKVLKFLVDKLDIEKQQVYVKAKIVELSDKKTKEIGVKYGLEKLKLGSSNALSLAADFGGSADVIKTISLPAIADGVLLGASVKFLQNNDALNVVSEPSLLCLNNKSSLIYVGETRSVKSGATTGSSSTETYSREDIGLKLIVKPRITNDQKVNLEINATLEDIKNEDGSNNQPDTTKKEVQTLAVVSDGQSVIVGGLIKTKNEILDQKVPFFGDLPFVGHLFKNKYDQNDKINLVIILTPYIVKKSEDLSSVGARISQLAKIEDEINANIAKSLTKK